MVSALVLLDYNNPAYVFSITPKLNTFFLFYLKKQNWAKLFFI